MRFLAPKLFFFHKATKMEDEQRKAELLLQCMRDHEENLAGQAEREFNVDNELCDQKGLETQQFFEVTQYIGDEHGLICTTKSTYPMLEWTLSKLIEKYDKIMAEDTHLESYKISTLHTLRIFQTRKYREKGG